MNITINLPVETINTIIDIDDKRVEVPISQYVQKFTDEEYQVRTMFSIPDSTEKIITYSHDIDFITELTKNEVGNTNNIRYFNVIAKYYNNKEYNNIQPKKYVCQFSISSFHTQIIVKFSVACNSKKLDV